ncbi:unnamed protein product [Lupinus luteus]|uniref:RING-type E3 ubiquitin transferase n=1 Tax=Lupinus luteus TaxID=3873 RepID=A0AAV1WYJ7_LUPLU
MFGVAQELGSQTVDCVVTKKNVPSRGKVDVEKITHRESSSYLGRCPVTAGIISFLDTDPKIFEDSESFGPVAPYHHHIRDPLTDDSSHGFAEQLLDLGERIGYVNTGLKEDEMGCNIRKTKFQFSDDAAKHQADKKCSICQEEYEADDELGKLSVNHDLIFFGPASYSQPVILILTYRMLTIFHQDIGQWNDRGVNL